MQRPAVAGFRPISPMATVKNPHCPETISHGLPLPQGNQCLFFDQFHPIAPARARRWDRFIQNQGRLPADRRASDFKKLTGVNDWNNLFSHNHLTATFFWPSQVS
jgi:hypothetical protein